MSNISKLLNWYRGIKTDEEMVLVTGMPKSGTTVIASLLGAAVRKQVCNDPFYQLTQMQIDYRDDLFNKRLLLSELWKNYRKIFSGGIVKDPNFISFLHQLEEMFPDAKMLFIIRDPRDNIRSILNRLNLPGEPLGVDLVAAGIKGVGWRSLLSGVYPDAPGEDYIEILAWRWRVAAETYHSSSEKLHLIRYEDFKKDKYGEIHKLARTMGYTDLYDIAHLVDIQYQPKGNTTISWEDFFGERQLKKIERIVAPIAHHFGYQV